MKKEYGTKLVLETLIKLEQDGYAFYKEAAEAISDTKAKKLFEKLAADESKHEKTFKKLLEKSLKSPNPQLEEEDAAYLNMLLAQFDPLGEEEMKKAKQAWTKEHALKIAERLERNAILMLSEVLNIDPNMRNEKEIIFALKEERRHLSDIRQSMMDMQVGNLML